MLFHEVTFKDWNIGKGEKFADKYLIFLFPNSIDQSKSQSQLSFREREEINSIIWQKELHASQGWKKFLAGHFLDNLSQTHFF